MSAFYQPPWLDKIRFALRFYVSGCEAPWGVYAEAAFDEAKEITMILAGVSMADIVKEFFRPAGLRSKRHGRKGRKSRGRSGGIPDLNELYGKRLRGDLDIADRKYGIPTRAFYVVDDIIDRAAWTVLLLEMSQDLVYETLLGVAQFDSAACATLRRMWRKSGYRVEGAPLGAWHPYTCGAIQYINGVSSPNGALVFNIGGKLSVTLGSLITSPVQTTSVQVRFRNTDPPFQIFDQTDWIQVGPGVSKEFILNTIIDQTQGVAIEARETVGFFDVIHDDLMVLDII